MYVLYVCINEVSHVIYVLGLWLRWSVWNLTGQRGFLTSHLPTTFSHLPSTACVYVCAWTIHISIIWFCTLIVIGPHGRWHKYITTPCLFALWHGARCTSKINLQNTQMCLLVQNAHQPEIYEEMPEFYVKMCLYSWEISIFTQYKVQNLFKNAHFCSGFLLLVK